MSECVLCLYFCQCSSRWCWKDCVEVMLCRVWGREFHKSEEWKKKDLVCRLVLVLGRRTFKGLRWLRLELRDRWVGMHSERGLVLSCCFRRRWNMARLVMARLHLREGQSSCFRRSSFGVIQSALSTVLAMLAWIRSSARAAAAGVALCQSGLAYSSTGRT